MNYIEIVFLKICEMEAGLCSQFFQMSIKSPYKIRNYNLSVLKNRLHAKNIPHLSKRLLILQKRLAIIIVFSNVNKRGNTY
jgi:hypothetical protein